MIANIISIVVPFVCGIVVGSLLEVRRRRPKKYDFPAAPSIRGWK